MMTSRCLLIGQTLLLIHHRHFWSQISTIGPYHCIRNDLIKSHFRRLRFDQNNSGLMNGPYSISDPVARRLCCTKSYPSARSSARLNSRLMTWQVGPTMLTCQLTGRWHGMPTVHAGVMLTTWWRHYHPGLACGSGHLVFGSGQPI
jgi:hypothetical protein